MPHALGEHPRGAGMRFDPPDQSAHANWVPPVVTGGRLYLQDQDALLCYDVRAKAGG